MTFFKKQYSVIFVLASAFAFPGWILAHSAVIDSTLQDSSYQRTIDSIRFISIPVYLPGSIDRNLAGDMKITDTTINFNDYKYIGDLVKLIPGIFIRDHGSSGDYSGITLHGLDDHNIAFMSDGVLLNDPLTGNYNLNLYPSENIETIEHISGVRSFLYGLNSTGGAINFVSKSRKAIHPYSRIRYSESAYGYTFFDGMLSQDIIRNLNMTAGVQHATYDGRFPNSDYDAWNLHTKLRYNISNNFNIYISEVYNKTQLGLNGGVDGSTLPSLMYEPLQAKMRNTDSYEKITRHDLQLCAAAKLFPDPNTLTTLTLYHTTSLREYRDEENRLNPNNIYIKDDFRTQWFGAKVCQHLELDDQKMDFGGEIQSRAVVASPTTGQQIKIAKNLFGKTEFCAAKLINLGAYGRLDEYLDNSRLSYGSDVTIILLPWMETYAGYSRSFRFPTLQELYWRDNSVSSNRTSLLPERHHLVETGFRINHENLFSLQVKFFQRYIWDAIGVFPAQLSSPFQTIQYRLIDKITLRGIEGSGKINIWKFIAEGNIQYINIRINNDLNLLLPRWYAVGAVYFRDNLFNNHLDLKVGLRGHFFSSYSGSDFNPQTVLYVQTNSIEIPSAGITDFLIIARIGSAYIHLIWNNLINANYMITPLYPMQDRTLQFGISWEFSD